MADLFKFKQFNIDQSNCAMKVNTDGVLLGALASAIAPKRILDIGTGTGVIALMLAQHFPGAVIDAVEIDTAAAVTAGLNFRSSPYHGRISIYPQSIETYFDEHLDDLFDVIISNPPFYLNSLESPGAGKKLAKHAEVSFFESLMKDVSWHLSPGGSCWLILPLKTAHEVKELAAQNGLSVQKKIAIRSFEHSEPHREILCLGTENITITTADFIIYDAPAIYSEAYKEILQPFFINF